MATKTAVSTAKTDLFSEENQVKSNFVKWDKPGQSVQGTYVEKKVSDNRLKPGTQQTLYLIEQDDGLVVIVAGRGNANPSVIVGLENLTFGSYCGVRYEGDIESKKPGMNPAKIIRVYSTGLKKLDVLERYQKRNSPFSEESEMSDPALPQF